jgi:hypothetical protein
MATMMSRVDRTPIVLLAVWLYLLAAVQPALHTCRPHVHVHDPVRETGVLSVEPSGETDHEEIHGGRGCVACHLGVMARDLPPAAVRIAEPAPALCVETPWPGPHPTLLAATHLPRGPPFA